MNFSDWEPIYTKILADFAFDRQKDEDATMVLKDLLKQNQVLSIFELEKIIKNQKLFIFGNGPTLASDIESSEFDGVIVAADGATSALMNAGIIPDIIVTDLDGHVPDQIQANLKGARIVLHAHGDNIPEIKHWAPKFKNFISTTQAQPDEENNIYNFGGFTDGDRAVYLGAHFNAKKITLVAFNFEEVADHSYKKNPETKLRKLTWANLLIGMVKEPPVAFHFTDRE